jgi:sporulation protein YlmC with PRC-barrel domain
MHVRLSLVLGLPVYEEGSHEVLALLRQPLINADTGGIEGFFVRQPGGFLETKELFLQVADIARWGTRVTVSRSEALCDVTDIFRLQALQQSKRAVLMQKMYTKSGTYLGRCTDIQFETMHFTMEWLFPRRWYGWGVPVSTSAVLEITSTHITVRDAVLPEPVQKETALREVPEPA